MIEIVAKLAVGYLIVLLVIDAFRDDERHVDTEAQAERRPEDSRGEDVL